MLSIMEMYVHGVSTRKVASITETLCGTNFSKSQVSALSGRLDVDLKAWRNRPLTGSYTWVGTGNSLVSAHAGGAHLGSGSLGIAYDPEGSGAVTGLSTGGITSSNINPGESYTFSVYVRSESAAVDSLWLGLSGDITSPSISGPFQATTEWQRFSVTTDLGSDDSGLEASVYRSGGGAATDIYN